MANWFDLPKDLLERICDICIAPDHIRMQCVCRSWRSILKKIIHRELPWLMMLPNKEDDEHQDARFFFSLSKQKIHTFHLPEIRGKRCCGSFQNGWLMLVDEKLDICLFHPWTKKKINLPHQSTFKDQIFDLECATVEEMRDLNIRKAALSDDGEVVVVIYGVGTTALCRIGDEAYTHIGMTSLDDVVYHKGCFYALSQVASVYVLHIEDEPHWEELTPELESLPYTIFGYLVPDILTDSMFVITRQVKSIEIDGTTGEVKYLDDDRDTDDLYPRHKTIHFDTYSVTLEEESGAQTKFTKMENLGDRVLFLGYNSSRLVNSQDSRGNCIYFGDNMIDRYCYSTYGCRDSGVFRLEDGTVEELFADRFHPILSPPLWIAIPPYSSRRDFGREKLCLEEPHVDVCT
eukprot:TRINITY_DN11275_c0_g3_i1.p1 TRINITY_DN11275_c0_g3~~TRINITY_DN11275_c0_g3_i1.p1  ORF type:complete len:404 (-),score=38.64 TRINITY_DN11275_c0_g3_i1:554-1765(-)